MLLEIVLLSITIISVLVVIAALNSNRKLKKQLKEIIGSPPTIEAKATSVASTPSPTIAIIKDKTKYKQFLDEYDGTKDLQFGNVSFRLGARNSCAFGLSEGYRMVNNEYVWDSVRIHTGVDRSRGGTIKTLKDAVVSPFNFERTEIIDYGDTGYGTLTTLFNDKYDFCLRIAHMHPETNIIPWSLEQFKKKAQFKQGWLLGSAGNYGNSDGAHTHSEVASQGGSSEVLEQLLYDKFGQLSLTEYSTEEIIAFYKTRGFFKRKSEREMLQHWMNLKLEKNIVFINKYLYRRVVGGKTITFYNSWALFNM
jgi:hypothetical protein